MNPRGRAAMCAAAIIACAIASAGEARAQGTAQAPMRRGRFEVIAPQNEARLARALLDEAVANDTFPGLPRPVAAASITLAQSAEEFRALVGPGAPEWGSAIAFPREGRIIMHGGGAAAKDGDPRRILRHELAHLALREAVPDAPRWFDEGYASFAAGEWGRTEVIATSVGLVWRGLPTLAGLDSGFYAGSEQAQRAYALAHHAVAELSALGGERGLTLLFDHWRRDGSFERALRNAYGMSTTEFERRWRAKVRRQFGALSLMADLAALGIVGSVLLIPLWRRRRRRDQERLARMRAADAAREEAERRSALSALLGEGGASPDDERIKGS